MAKRKPKLGQHFLTDSNYRRRILDSLVLRADDLVIEIGPGRGAMTSLLAARARALVAIEIDAALAGRLRDEFSAEKRVEIVGADILQVDVQEICRRHAAEQAFVFGNLPYYITSPILRHLLRFRDAVRAMALMMQSEVADRVTAAPGTRDYGLLSVLVQLETEPRIALEIPPGAFSPPPQVRSSLVSFDMRPMFPEWSAARREMFLDFAQRAFLHKRKSLANNLAGFATRGEVERNLKDLGLPRTTRAEQVTAAQLAALADRLKPDPAVSPTPPRKAAGCFP